MILALDYLGGANYGNLIAQEHPAGWGAGFILNTNRPYWPKQNAWPVIDSLLATGRCPLIRVHAIWDDAHKFRPEYKSLVKKEFARALDLKCKYPDVTVEFSWMCENNMTRQENVAMYGELQDLNGKNSIVLVNSVYKGAIIASCKNEVHGSTPAPRGDYNYSYDGDDCFQADINKDLKAFKNAEVLFFWSYRMNGRFSAKDRRPRNELKNTWPFPKYVDAMIALQRDVKPQGLPDKYIYKAVAEDSGNGDWKDNKPCVIIPTRTKEVLFVCKNGQVAGRAQYYGSFSGGGYRYYSEAWGFEIADKAYRIQKSFDVTLVADGKKLGVINPARRAGKYR